MVLSETLACSRALQFSLTKCVAETFHPGAASVQNQLTGYGYDAAGNMTSDPTDSVTSTYDAENRIATASTPLGVFTYPYDADGNRVEKSGAGTGTLYWYMTPGIIGESDLSGVMKSEYVFFNGERVARRDFDPTTGTPTGVFYYFSDHLKTASIVTDSAGNIKSESDYYPWGGELQFVNNDSNHYKFTGKERDTESGLDYFGARYYSNGLGRFITPDWAAKATAVPYAEFADPQSLNLYSYVRNVPTTRADSDGHCPDGMDICFMPQLAQNEAYKQGIHEGAKQGMIALAVAGAAAVGGPLLARAGAAIMLRAAPLATAIGKAAINARDEVSGALTKLNGAVQSGALKLSTVTQGRLGGAINAAEEHMTNSDIKGAIRQAATGAEQGGDHLQEIKNTAQSFQNLRDSLSGALKDPKLSDSSRQLFTDTVGKLNKAIDAVKNIRALQDRH